MDRLAGLASVVDSSSKRLRSLGEMAAGIAHEFRNGLATMLGNAKLLGQSVSSEEDNTVVDALVEECSSLNRVVTEFLQFARSKARGRYPLTS